MIRRPARMRRADDRRACGARRSMAGCSADEAAAALRNTALLHGPRQGDTSLRSPCWAAVRKLASGGPRNGRVRAGLSGSVRAAAQCRCRRVDSTLCRRRWRLWARMGRPAHDRPSRLSQRQPDVRRPTRVRARLADGRLGRCSVGRFLGGSLLPPTGRRARRRSSGSTTVSSSRKAPIVRGTTAGPTIGCSPSTGPNADRRWLPLDGPVEAQVGHAPGEQGQRLLQLGAGQRCAEAEVDAGAEGHLRRRSTARA